MGIEFGTFNLEVWILQAQLKCEAPSENSGSVRRLHLPLSTLLPTVFPGHCSDFHGEEPG